MKRERLFNWFWVLFSIYVLFYVVGQANDLVGGLFPNNHHAVETHEKSYAHLTPVEVGEQVLRQQGCIACHMIGLQGGTLGPSLSNVGGRRNEEWLHEQLIAPQAAVPGNYMPSYAHLTQQERNGLVAYLSTLNGNRAGPETEGPVNLVRQERFTEAQIERGTQLFAQNNCNACHLIGADGNAIGPNLTHEGLRGRTDEWQKDHLAKPLSVYVYGEVQASWMMQDYERLGNSDLDALVAYLQSLR
jgi:cytochrome c2